MKKYITEFIGAFFLVLTIGLVSTGEANAIAPLAIAGILAVMIYAGGYISGAHYNPAVTLSVFLRGKIEMGEAGKYMLSQILGAIVAALVVLLTVGKHFSVAPNPENLLGAVILEFLFTFALAYTVLHVATSKNNEGNSHYGLAIGTVILVGAIVAGPISGGAFNPAVAIGTILVDTANLGAHIGNIFLYIIPEFVGGMLAAGVYRFTSGE